MSSVETKPTNNISKTKIPLEHHNRNREARERSPTWKYKTHHFDGYAIKKTSQERKQKLPEYTFGDEKYLSKFLQDLSKHFKESDKYMAGADTAYALIDIVGSDEVSKVVSRETIEKFQESINNDAERRSRYGLDSDFFVDIKSDPDNPRIVKSNIDSGQSLLQNNLHFISNLEPEMARIFNGFEEPSIRFGALTVLTLKELEAERIDETTPVQLSPRVERVLKSA